jgi:predicted component of type VI protein secretion system
VTLGVGRFAGDHHEHRREGQQLFAPQLVEQVLPGHLAALEVQLAQHQVEAAVLEDVACFLDPAGLHHRADAEVAQLSRQHAARVALPSTTRARQLWMSESRWCCMGR